MGQQITSNTQLMFGAVDSATALEKGDLVMLDTDDIKPASSEPWVTDEATTRTNYVAHHIGVAATRHAANSGDATGFPVNTDGTFSFDAVADSYEIGDLVGPAKDSGNALLATVLKKVTSAGEAVGYVIDKSGASATSIKVRVKQRKAAV
ncbi:MAG: hypothetical protein ACREJ2_04620 [Planctomycetota bacterium]